MFTMIVRDLRLSFAKTVLTALSMLIGIIAVIAASLVGSIGGDFLAATNAQLSGRAATYQLNLTLGDNEIVTAYDMLNMASAMEQVDGYAMAPAVMQDDLQVISNPKTGDAIPNATADVVLTTAAYNNIYVLPMVSGRWFSQSDAQAGIEIVVNKPGQNMYGTTGDSVAFSADRTQTITKAFITGVVNDGSSTPRMYINAVTFSLFEPQLWDPTSMHVICHPLDSTASTQQISSLVDDVVHDNINGKVTSIQRIDNSDSYADVLQYLQIAFFVCGFLLLFVAALGLINIGLADIEQRSHELLIRRALGASRGNVMVLVAGSSIVLSVCIAALAITISIVLVMVIPLFIPADAPIPNPSYPYQAAQYALAASILTAMLGSIVPAIKAAQLEPAMALR
ncbi:ABC transporter permease [Bifidobacterium oedipodis]|uniref:ABC transporter substrate-binding protein n=1 Tax=Bifidobacterium oedipodis TaxID=2675322 RepID=A0A7Y0HSK0_9BIFI|nr:ABC transporter permease [Bifidobacterium sp. DSM 109957]NMM93678.1 ABC transporter substrate-binding protein [Bifidobacterium sp. DSM 109957]